MEGFCERHAENDFRTKRGRRRNHDKKIKDEDVRIVKRSEGRDDARERNKEEREITEVAAAENKETQEELLLFTLAEKTKRCGRYIERKEDGFACLSS